MSKKAEDLTKKLTQKKIEAKQKQAQRIAEQQRIADEIELKLKQQEEQEEQEALELEEIAQAIIRAEEEEVQRVQNVNDTIKKLCEENNLYCGLVLTSDDVANIVKFAIDSKENISIPFRLYNVPKVEEVEEIEYEKEPEPEPQLEEFKPIQPEQFEQEQPVEIYEPQETSESKPIKQIKPIRESYT